MASCLHAVLQDFDMPTGEKLEAARQRISQIAEV